MNNGIINESPFLIRKTPQYAREVQRIKTEGHSEYTKLLNDERNPVKRAMLKIRMILRVRKKIGKLTSRGSLY